MASYTKLILFSIFFLASTCYAQRSFRPKALVLPITKDNPTLQYVTKINQRTPSVGVNLAVDLGGKYLWVDCENNYISSTYRPVRCRSSQCSLAGANGCGDCFSPPRPGCNNNTCGVSPDNPFTGTATSGELAEDTVYIQSTDGSNPGPVATISRFIFTCSPSFLLQGLAGGSLGIAGLGRTRVALPSQLASAFSFPRKFAICLPSSGTTGVIFFGNSSYELGFLDASQLLTYTPLVMNPVSTSSAEYFIKVNSLKVSDTVVRINSSLLTIDSEGRGGTKISTTTPYTVLESSIYKAVTETFVSEAAKMNIGRVEAAGPFEACFNRSNILVTRIGPSLPPIRLVLDEEEKVVWNIVGSNSMVDVGEEVSCLGFVNGGLNPWSSIVIGGHQLEDNLLQFDLARSRLGFTSSLFGDRTRCGNFNFTTSSTTP